VTGQIGATKKVGLYRLSHILEKMRLSVLSVIAYDVAKYQAYYHALVQELKKAKEELGIANQQSTPSNPESKSALVLALIFPQTLSQPPPSLKKRKLTISVTPGLLRTFISRIQAVTARCPISKSSMKCRMKLKLTRKL